MKNSITVNEAMELSGYTRQQMYNLIRGGRVRAERRGWEYWVDRRSLEAYCRAQGKILAAVV